MNRHSFALGAALLLLPVLARSAEVVTCAPRLPPDSAKPGQLAGNLLSGKIALGVVSRGREFSASAKTAATVDRIPVRKGQRVLEGAVLVSLDEADARRELEKAKAVEREMESEIARLEANRRRVQKEATRRASYPNLFSKEERDSYEESFRASEAELAKGQAALKRGHLETQTAQIKLESMTLKAPVSGLVETVRASVGQIVSEGETLVVIRSEHETLARILVPIAVKEKPRVGTQMCAYDPASEFAGKVDLTRVEETYDRTLDGFIAEGRFEPSARAADFDHGASLLLSWTGGEH